MKHSDMFFFATSYHYIFNSVYVDNYHDMVNNNLFHFARVIQGQRFVVRMFYGQHFIEIFQDE
jgi:hypothetical protein